MLIVIDTDTHSDTNDIICYMIVFWELKSYWGNFKIFLHCEWNEKIWIIMWTYFLHRFEMKNTVLKFWIIMWSLWIIMWNFAQVWNFGSLCDHYEMKNTLFGTGFLNRLIYWYWVWKPNFFIIKKIAFFLIFQTDQTD